MAYHSQSFDTALGAAAGGDAALEAELRRALAASVMRQADLMRRARCDANWRVASERLRGIAASFHVAELIELADRAIAGAPGDPGVVTSILKIADELGQAT